MYNALKNRKKKIWGEEIWLVNNDDYCAKLLIVKKQHQCSFHMHKEKDETFVLQSGYVVMDVDYKERLMKPGQAVHIPPETYHRFAGLSDESVILEVSTHHSEEDSYRKTQSRHVPTDVFNNVKDYYGHRFSSNDTWKDMLEECEK